MAQAQTCLSKFHIKLAAVVLLASCLQCFLFVTVDATSNCVRAKESVQTNQTIEGAKCTATLKLWTCSGYVYGTHIQTTFNLTPIPNFAACTASKRRVKSKNQKFKCSDGIERFHEVTYAVIVECGSVDIRLLR